MHCTTLQFPSVNEHAVCVALLCVAGLVKVLRRSMKDCVSRANSFIEAAIKTEKDLTSKVWRRNTTR